MASDNSSRTRRNRDETIEESSQMHADCCSTRNGEAAVEHSVREYQYILHPFSTLLASASVGKFCILDFTIISFAIMAGLATPKPNSYIYDLANVGNALHCSTHRRTLYSSAHIVSSILFHIRSILYLHSDYGI